MIRDKLDKARKREQRNLTFFKQNMPAIYRQLEQNPNPPSIIIDPMNGNFGLSFVGNDEDYYKGQAMAFAAEEVARFNQKVDSTNYRDPHIPGYLPHLIQENAFHNTQSFLREHDRDLPGEQLANVDIVVFGVGLGYHVEILANQRKYRSITLVENDISRFAASLYCVDWEGILTNLPSQHSVTFIVKSPGVQGQRIYNNDLKVRCVELFPSLTCSSLRYSHTPTAEQFESEKQILKEYSNFVSVVYEKLGPDTHRLINALENSRNHIKVMDFESSHIQDHQKVAVVGAGPSLDIYIEDLKRNRDRLYIITVGTGLSSVLGMGLRPDAHLELEYKILAKDLLEHLNDKHDLSDIDLITTIEANPGFVKLFKDVISFIPETSGMKELYEQRNVLTSGGVNCANAAVSVISKISRCDIILFGIDYAFTDGEHHSKDNISQHIDLPKELSKLKTDLSRYSRTVESNFGTKIGTKATLDSARLVLEEMIESISNKIYNCSHGARIRGTHFVEKNEIQSIVGESKSENKTPFFSSITSKYDASLNHIENIFKNASIYNKAIIDSISKYENRRDQILKIFKILNELKQFQKESFSGYQAVMSFNRLPFISLYKGLNNLNNDESATFNKIWIDDYRNFTNKTNKIITSILKESPHIVETEWTDIHFKG